MATYYKFKPTAGYALAIGADVTGENLPPVTYGRWVLVETLEILPGDGVRFGPDADAIIKGVREEGFYVWADKRPPEGEGSGGRRERASTRGRRVSPCRRNCRSRLEM